MRGRRVALTYDMRSVVLVSAFVSVMSHGKIHGARIIDGSS